MMLELELIDFRIIDFHDTSENELEFFVSFEKLSISANEDVSRYKMSKSIPHIVTDTWENTQQKRFLELEKSISRLTEQNKILFSEKDVLNDKLSLSDSKLLESNTKLKEIIHQLEQTYQSTSWKITKPIRNLKTMVTNFLRPNAHK
jgi:predicted transcriptional regulator